MSGAAVRTISTKASGPFSKSESLSISDDNEKVRKEPYSGRRNMSGNAAAVLKQPGFRKIPWLERDIAVERRGDGVIVLKSRIPLQPYEKHIPASLAKWANKAPERTWLAQPGGPGRAKGKNSFSLGPR